MDNQNSLLGQDQEPLSRPTSDEKTVGMLAHILTIFSSFLAPLIIYIIKKDESVFASTHAKESLNFQITVFIICFILAITIIGILLIWPVCIVSLILVIIATVRASEGKLYRYPFNFRFIK